MLIQDIANFGWRAMEHMRPIIFPIFDRLVTCFSLILELETPACTVFHLKFQKLPGAKPSDGPRSVSYSNHPLLGCRDPVPAIFSQSLRLKKFKSQGITSV